MTTDPSLRTIDLIAGSMSPLEIDYSRLNALQSLQAPTLFVGLGGGGTKAVSMLKSLFVKTFRGHLPPGADEVPAGYQFLAFDSDQSSRPGNLVNDSEWLHVGVSGLGFGEWDRLRTSPYYRDWLMTDIEEAGIVDGCKGFRNLGRLLAQLGGSRISTAIRNAETRARSYANLERNNVLNVYLFCTLGGGTGSGMILEITFMLRHLFRNLATIKINAMLACPEGFPQQDEGAQQTSRAGVYAALREVDHFMTGSSRKDWIEKLENDRPHGYVGGDGNTGVYQFPNSDACGLYSRPFNLCFLFGHQTTGGTKLLPNSADMSAFMARLAFALTTYPATADGQNFSSSMDNVLGQHLAESNVRNGAGLYYLVPGLISIHAPVAETFDLITLQAAIDLLRDLRTGGVSDPKNRDEAETLIQHTDSTLPAITEYLRDKVLIRYPQPNAMISEAMETLGKDRHAEASASSVFRVFNATVGIADPAKALEELRKSIWAEEITPEQRSETEFRDAPLTVKESLAAFKKQLFDACNWEMIQPKRRLAVVKDMLVDCKILLNDQLVICRENQKAAEAAYYAMKDSYAMDLKKSNHFYGMLSNVVDDQGVIDRIMEHGILTAVKRDYEGMAIQAYQKWLSYLLQPLIIRYMEELAAILDACRADIGNYESSIEGTEIELAQYVKTLERLLHGQEEGHVPLGDEGYPVDTCFSISIMNGKWRQKYVALHELKKPEKIQSLIQKHYPDWRPFDVLERQKSRTFNRTHAKLETFIGDDLCRVMRKHFDAEHDIYNMWESGAGLRRTMEFADDSSSGVSPMKYWMELLNEKCKPQWDTSLNQFRLNQEPLLMTMFAGPPSVTGAMVAAGNFAGGVNHSLSYESNRITMLRFAYPIGLPGCGSIHTPLRTSYQLKARQMEEALKKEGKDAEKGTHHKAMCCYPSSWTWKDPAEIYDDGDEFIGHFASMMMVNRLGENKNMETSQRELLDKALAEVKKVGGGPRTKGIGLYTRGNSEFWLCPFLEIEFSKNRIGAAEPTVQLGRGIEVAFNCYKASRHYVDEGVQWDRWLEDNLTALLTEADVLELRASVMEDLSKMLKSVESGSREFSLLQRMARTLR